MVVCTNCHTPIPAEGRFCHACGTPAPGAAPGAQDMSPQAREVFERLQHATEGRYEILRELGRGGMALVFLGYQKSLDREVAIKVLLPLLAYDPQIVERFQREARTQGKLEHPNIISVYEVYEEGGLTFFTMPYIRGLSLRKKLQDEDRLPMKTAIKFLRQAADALGYAHRRGMIHRDVKPENMLVDAEWDRIILTDFGIAKALAANTTLTTPGDLLGTPRYMSPEQGEGLRDLDGRSDLYSLGLIGHEMLTGQVAFQADSLAELIYKHRFEEPRNLRKLAPEAPPQLCDVIERAISKNRDERFQTMRDFIEALDTAARVVEAMPDPDTSGADLAATVRVPTPPQTPQQSPSPDTDTAEAEPTEEEITDESTEALDTGDTIRTPPKTPSDTVSYTTPPGYELPVEEAEAEPEAEVEEEEEEEEVEAAAEPEVEEVDEEEEEIEAVAEPEIEAVEEEEEEEEEEIEAAAEPEVEAVEEEEEEEIEAAAEPEVEEIEEEAPAAEEPAAAAEALPETEVYEPKPRAPRPEVRRPEPVAREPAKRPGIPKPALAAAAVLVVAIGAGVIFTQLGSGPDEGIEAGQATELEGGAADAGDESDAATEDGALAEGGTETGDAGAAAATGGGGAATGGARAEGSDAGESAGRGADAGGVGRDAAVAQQRRARDARAQAVRAGAGELFPGRLADLDDRRGNAESALGDERYENAERAYRSLAGDYAELARTTTRRWQALVQEARNEASTQRNAAVRAGADERARDRLAVIDGRRDRAAQLSESGDFANAREQFTRAATEYGQLAANVPAEEAAAAEEETPAERPAEEVIAGVLEEFRQGFEQEDLERLSARVYSGPVPKRDQDILTYVFNAADDLSVQARTERLTVDGSTARADVQFTLNFKQARTGSPGEMELKLRLHLTSGPGGWHVERLERR